MRVDTIVNFIPIALRRAFQAYILAFSAIVLISGSAFARDIDFSCSQGTFSGGQLCRNGSGQNSNCNQAPGGFSNNATDTVDITNVTAGTQITFSFTRHAGASQDQNFNIIVDGQNSTNGQFSPDPTNVPVTSALPTNSFTYTVTAADDAASPIHQSNFRVQLETNTNGRAAVTYSIACVAPGELKIIKKAPGGGSNDKFDFRVKKDGAVLKVVNDLKDNGSATVQLAPGSYFVEEVNVPGEWNFAKVNCGTGDKTDNPVAVNIVSGETKVCTFTNEKKAKLKIVKYAEGAGSSDKFDFKVKKDGIDVAAVTNLKHDESKTIDISPGSYSIEEVNFPNGWDFTKVNCGSGDQNANPVTVNVASGETKICTFTNTKKGKLEIKKLSVGGKGSFDITATGVGDPIVYTISTTASNPSSVTKDVAPGTYTIAEEAPDGWVRDSIVCEGNGSEGASAVVLSGKTTKCTVTNKSQGTITIVKKVVGGAGGEKFKFTLTDPQNGNVVLNPSSLGDGDSTTAQNLLVGAYTITEIVGPEWTLTVSGSNCLQYGNKVTVQVKAGETTTCTFTNTRKRGDLTIAKVVQGGPGGLDFTFSVSGQQGQIVIPGGESHKLSNLPTGTYTIMETNLPDGWTLKSISACGKVNLSNKSVTVDLTTDGTTCTFTNFKEKDDQAAEETKRFIHRRVDNLLTYGPDRARMLRRLQEQPTQQGLKDEPMKLSGVNGGAWPMTGGRSPMGVSTSSLPGVSFGTSPLGFGSGRSAPGYASPFRYDGFPYSEDVEEDFGSPFAHRPSLLGQLAGQFMPLAFGGTSFKFGTSLSEIRAIAAAAEAERERAKLEQAGLTFADQPYANRYATLRQGFDVWVEGHIARYNDDIGGIGRDGDFRILYVGADYVVAPGVLIGALVQIDDTKEDIDDPSLTGRIEGTGWMVGPYVGIRLSDNLFFDARAAWGRSSNDIALDDAVVGFRTGSFETDRWLASASLTGNEYIGPWRLSPQLAIAYGNEESDAYTTSLGQIVSSTGATIGRLTGTMEVGYRTQLPDGTLVEPHIAISGIWNFDADDLVFDGTVYNTDEARGRIEGGLIIQTPSGLGLRWAASYDGLGASDFNAVSGSLWVNIPLN